MSPRTEEANQRLRDEQRAKIMEGALKVFARRGLAATMAEVATEAGVSQGLAYRYFAGKDDLFRALVRESLQPTDTPQLTGTPGARLELLLTRVFASRREHPEMVQIFYHVLSDPSAPTDIIDAARSRMEFLTEIIRSLIVEAQASGEVRAGDPEQLVTAVFACLTGLTLLAHTDPERARNHFPDTEIMLRMLRP